MLRSPTATESKVMTFILFFLVANVVHSFSPVVRPAGTTIARGFAPQTLHVVSNPITMEDVSQDGDDDDVSSSISISGENIDLTPALVSHVEKRIGGPLKKLSGTDGAVQDCDVVLSVNKNPKVKNGHRVEVVANLKGTTLICRNESPDMYGSIDMASHALNRKLLKYKERRIAGWHGGPSMSDNLLQALKEFEEEIEASGIVGEDVVDEFMDPDKPTVTKIKSFDLSKPINLDEAIFALDYVDHDFYVFRNEETNDINVVYKRNVGGVGLIEP